MFENLFSRRLILPRGLTLRPASCLPHQIRTGLRRSCRPLSPLSWTNNHIWSRDDGELSPEVQSTWYLLPLCLHLPTLLLSTGQPVPRRIQPLHPLLSLPNVCICHELWDWDGSWYLKAWKCPFSSTEMNQSVTVDPLGPVYLLKKRILCNLLGLYLSLFEWTDSTETFAGVKCRETSCCVLKSKHFRGQSVQNNILYNVKWLIFDGALFLSVGVGAHFVQWQSGQTETQLWRYDLYQGCLSGCSWNQVSSHPNHLPLNHF